MGLVRSLIAALLLLAGAPNAGAAVVRAEQYDSFWLWGGVKPQPVLAKAQNLYILQGQVVEKTFGEARRTMIIAQGMSVPQLTRGAVWLVYRAETLRWSPAVIRVLMARVERWRLAGNPVTGLQVDFDVRTRCLAEYVAFLRELRAQLPADCRLGITGLLDWSSNGDVGTINGLRNIVDEVIIQTYQGRATIPDHARYLPRLKRLTIPFKIGLLQNGHWQPPEGFEANPWFRGYVVFLRNQPP